MRRREFMTLLGGAAAWPLAARARGAAAASWVRGADIAPAIREGAVEARGIECNPL